MISVSYTEMFDRLKSWKENMVGESWWDERDEEVFLVITVLLSQPKDVTGFVLHKLTETPE
jgi:hypothetical protein